MPFVGAKMKDKVAAGGSRELMRSQKTWRSSYANILESLRESFDIAHNAQEE